ncbi:bifunctional 5,10-methylenetetrahydrofolate dehydrogenase/5,10-methenyltetrahydrofolate cyclohydrolase [Salinigranum salinum]|uniref:bifunctional 5,10-methylenetetrahydrofolate dehydrogenase/5,10-methenyltetrahydrofolate cyclohydrolase n=1 Tax=Salinigranum salinum TaxID=1364937 RepID=UPI00126092A0|nr:tetrahydrofolate dehydrogenase/cyclohydrolase catalytic domain-containing protein [Salinigranum salinum]
MSTRRLRGDPVAATLRAEVRERVATLGERGRVPTLATVLMSDDPTDERFVELKHDACDEVGIETRDCRFAPDAPAQELYETVERLSTAVAVDAVFVQVPLPERVSVPEVRRRIVPEKDVDCFHPENVGRLVAGDPRFVPATPAAVQHLLAAYGISTAGQDVVIVGRSDAIGKPLANLLVGKGPGGDATTTVCHSYTRNLAAKTRRADVVVTACGVPELVDGSMLSPGVVVVDVSANRRSKSGDGGGSGGELVGDVDFESATEKASAITPVPGGIGPVTLAALVGNVVRAAEGRAGNDE